MFLRLDDAPARQPLVWALRALFESFLLCIPAP